jgi:hypothetical protein
VVDSLSQGEMTTIVICKKFPQNIVLLNAYCQQAEHATSIA